MRGGLGRPQEVSHLPTLTVGVGLFIACPDRQALWGVGDMILLWSSGVLHVGSSNPRVFPDYLFGKEGEAVLNCWLDSALVLS